MFKDIAKLSIWYATNWHQQGNKEDIALVGSRRSGSTLLMQMIAQENGVKWIDQPFSPYIANKRQVRMILALKHGLILHETEEIMANLQRFFAYLRKGTPLNQSWRFWRSDHSFYSDRLLFKTTAAQFIVQTLALNNFQIVGYMRHPIPQSLSCIRNGWGHKLDKYFADEAFIKDHLDAQQYKRAKSIFENGDTLEKYVLSWCIENKNLFENQGKFPVVFYESLLTDPQSTITELSAYLDVTNLAEMLHALSQPSNSVSGLSTQGTSDDIAKGNHQNLLASWRAQISATDVTQAQSVLSLFPMCPYRADTFLPIAQKQAA